MKSDTSEKFLKIASGIPFLSCLSPQEIDLVRKRLIEKHFNRGETILHEEDTPNFLYFIYAGKVKVIQISQDGRERILAIHKRGDFFGEMAALDGKTSPATVVALEDAEVAFLSREDFESQILKNTNALRELILMLCSRIREAWLMLRVAAFSDAEDRMRAVLKNMCDHFGVADSRGTILNVKLTHRDIAYLASTSRETATRLLNTLERQGELETLEGKYILLKSPFFQNLPIT
jgi:CRP/FNR family transcriptional regulator